MLTTEQRTGLDTRERSRTDPAHRAWVILRFADGDSYAAITAKTGCSSRGNALWKRRF
jgi:hypothetical protein